MELVSVNLTIGNKAVDTATATTFGTALLSSNPASQSAEFSGKSRLDAVNAILPIVDKLQKTFKDTDIVLSVELKDSEKGKVTKSRTIPTANLKAVLQAVKNACEAANILDKYTHFVQTVENPSTGTRGRKASGGPVVNMDELFAEE